MTPETRDLFHAIASADAIETQRALNAGADVNAHDDAGRNIISHAALGPAIDAIDAAVQPRLSERRVDILQLISQHPELSLYSLNAPIAWAGGVTLLGLMAWLNMPSEIMCFLDFAEGLLEVNAMDEQGATPLMYATRDGNLLVVQRLLAFGARPDLKDVSQRSAIQYALPHPQILWLCEEFLRRERSRQPESGNTKIIAPGDQRTRISNSSGRKSGRAAETLFFSPPTHRLLTPPPLTWFDGVELRRTFDSLLDAISNDDLDTLRSILFFARPNSNPHISDQCLGNSASYGVSLLVNSRDGAGLTLMHHAVSQRPYPSIAVLDALYKAGSDVGLFSTLGFAPLHHLARTAKDHATIVEAEQDTTVPPTVHPLYTFTTHIVGDLHAPLCATDNKGETPLHAAAEHGRSSSVLRAMLDCDKEFSGKEAVREVRNARGLRPVDVARPEFLSLFLGDNHNHTLSSSRPRRHSPPDTQCTIQGTLACDPLCPSSVGSGLAKKDSNNSLTSRTSGSSSTSSGTYSQGSYWSHNETRLSRKPTTPIHALPTPDLTPPGSFSGPPPSVQESYGPIDAPACATDILRNLSFCASALQAYFQPESNVCDMNLSVLPDLHSLSETLLFTRDLAFHMLEHWTARLESARDGFERAKRELGKAEVLRERVEKEVRLVTVLPEKQEERTGTAYKLNCVGTKPRLGKHGGLIKHVGVQTDLNSPSHNLHSSEVVTEVSEAYELMATKGIPHAADLERLPTTLPMDMPSETRMETNGSQGVVAPEDRTTLEAGDAHRREEGGYVRGTKRSFTGSIRRKVQSGSHKLELERVLNEESCAVGRDVNSPKSVKFPEKNPGLRQAVDCEVDLSWTWLQNTPRVLEHVDRDIYGIVSHLGVFHQSFMRAQQIITQARVSVEQAIKSREHRLNMLIDNHHRQDTPTQSSHLPRITEQSPGGKYNPPSLFSSIHELASPASSTDPRHIAAMSAMEDPHLLRRLLTRKLAKYVDRVFDDLQKAHVWLRIVREVLRGLRRRASV